MKESNNTGSGCPYFSDCLTCRNCEFSLAPQLFDGGCLIRPIDTVSDSGEMIRISGTPFFIMGSVEVFRAAMDEAIVALKPAKVLHRA